MFIKRRKEYAYSSILSLILCFFIKLSYNSMAHHTLKRYQKALVKLEEVKRKYVEKYGEMAESPFARKKIYEEAAEDCEYAADTLKRIEYNKLKKRGVFSK